MLGKRWKKINSLNANRYTLNPSFMTLSLHTIKPASGSRHRRVRVGRGGKRGTTSGRGTKGQRARASGRKGLAMKGLRRMALSVPKLGGFRSRYEKVPGINLGDLEKHFTTGETVTSKALVAKGLLPRVMGFKVLGGGPRALSKALIIKARGASSSARLAIEKAGGKLIVV